MPDVLTPQVDLPAYMALFVVGVRVADAGHRGERAEEIVDRYLYGRAEVTRCDLNNFDRESDAMYLVTVRREFAQGENVTYLLQAQRDRLATGFYPMGDPVIYGPMGV